MKLFTILLNLAKKNPYPVGSIYMSINNTNPSTLFGGTWEQIKDTFLLSAGDTYTAGATGGEAEHTLTTNEMPSHSHNFVNGGSALCLGVTSGTEITGGFASGAYWNNVNKRRSDIASTGGGQPHNNMPPYLTVYMWKRTA